MSERVRQDIRERVFEIVGEPMSDEKIIKLLDYVAEILDDEEFENMQVIDIKKIEIIPCVADLKIIPRVSDILDDTSVIIEFSEKNKNVVERYITEEATKYLNNKIAELNKK